MWERQETVEAFPIMLMQDRYRGVYSGGGWLAVAEASNMFDEANTRAQFCLISEDGPFGSDLEAGLFWNDPPPWIAVGHTPDAALQALQQAWKPVQ